MIRIAFALAVLAQPAQAHGALPGGGGFYSGALHPLVAVEQLLVLVALGLVLGREGLRRPLWALGLGLAGGLWVQGPLNGAPQVLLAASLGLGAVLVLRLPLREALAAGILLGLGQVLGLDTDLPQDSPLAAALGVGTAVALITLNAFALGQALRQTIALRIAGAWIAAVALMVLALTFRSLA